MLRHAYQSDQLQCPLLLVQYVGVGVGVWACLGVSSPPQSVLSIILGGGAGTRLYPLTKKRAKPAVPLGANYRLIDIPVSNCINSGVRKIYVLTQFNSASLNRHLSRAYSSNMGGYQSEGFVEVLAAQQSPDNPNWFQVHGTGPDSSLGPRDSHWLAGFC